MFTKACLTFHIHTKPPRTFPYNQYKFLYAFLNCPMHLKVTLITMGKEYCIKKILDFRCGLPEFFLLLECYAARLVSHRRFGAMYRCNLQRSRCPYVVPKCQCEANLRCVTSQKTTEFHAV